MVITPPNGTQRRIRAREAAIIRAPSSADASCPTNGSSAAVRWHLEPGGAWSMVTGSAAGAAQAARHSGVSSRALRIDGLLLQDPAHLELAVLDCETEPALAEVGRVLAELGVT